MDRIKYDGGQDSKVMLEGVCSHGQTAGDNIIIPEQFTAKN